MDKTPRQIAQDFYDHAVNSVVMDGIQWANGKKPEWENLLRYNLGRLSGYRDLMQLIPSDTIKEDSP